MPTYDVSGSPSSGYPLFYDSSTGLAKRLSGDLLLAGTRLILDADNAGTGVDCEIVANQGSDDDGVIRYSTSNNQWELSNTGGNYYKITTQASSLTAGSVPFSDSNGNLAQDNSNLYWDNTNKRLGIGVTPTSSLHVKSTASNTTPVLTVDKSPGTSQAGTCLAVITGANSTGTALDISVSGSGSGLVVTDNATGSGSLVSFTRSGGTGAVLSVSKTPGSATAGNVVAVSTNANTTGDGIRITHQGTGAALRMDVSGTGYGIHIPQTGANGTANALIEISQSSSATGSAIQISRTTTDTSVMLTLSHSPVSSAAGECIRATTSTNSTGTGIRAIAGGSSTGLLVESNSTTCNTAIIRDGTGIANTNSLLSLIRDQTNATGAVLNISKQPGSATSGTGINITMGANTTGNGIVMTMVGTGSAISINKSNTGAGDVVSITNSGTGNGLAISPSGTGSLGLQVTEGANAGSGSVNLFTRSSANNADMVRINNNPSTSSAGIGLRVYNRTNTTGPGIQLQHEGTGYGIEVRMGTSAGVGTSGGGIRVLDNSNSPTNTGPFLALTSSTPASTANLIELNRSPSTSGSGDGVLATFGANASGNAITISHAGSGLGMSIVKTGVGVTQQVGLSMSNTTAATSGNQKYSPMLSLAGNGWKTDATAASQPVEFAMQVQPVQGAANPTGKITYYSRINSGSYTEIGSLGSSGELSVLGTMSQKTHAAFTGSEYKQFTAAVQTTDATVNNTVVATLSTNTLGWVEVVVVGRDTANTERAMYGKRALVYRNAGNAQIQSVVDVHSDVETSASLDATITASNNDIQLAITGLAATTINWVATITYQLVSGNT